MATSPGVLPSERKTNRIRSHAIMKTIEVPALCLLASFLSATTMACSGNAGADAEVGEDALDEARGKPVAPPVSVSPGKFSLTSNPFESVSTTTLELEALPDGGR